MGSVSQTSFPFAPSPCSTQLRQRIAVATREIQKKALALDVNALALPPYAATYLGKIFTQLPAVLRKQSYLLEHAICATGDPGRTVLVDHGGGMGIMSLLARHAGVGHVIYNDINPISCSAAQLLADKLGAKAHDYVCGGIPHLQEFLTDQQLNVSALTSSNVIEHVYDLNHFAEMLSNLGNPDLTLAMATNIVDENRRRRRRFMAYHRKLEQRGRGTGSPSYLSIRDKLIRSHAPTLGDDCVRQLASRTRGQAKDDILRVVNRFLSDKALPPEPEHPTNTCDPESGDTCDRLLPAAQLAAPFERVGFHVRILSGFYAPDGRASLDRFARKSANLAIRMMGRHGLAISPFLTIHAQRMLIAQ